ncbi:hypothetical protein Mp_zg00960 [Marchantia polymorpha subsp. ruderalis]|uniref:Uncharacterized protein n=1 Tax=Marchantia polymorpha subsp. ruderalis TaxID=1480154 RepID=A0A679DXW8_MARPO|nr:hypothetical protein Mp_1g00010 [Marchantia polymorpha subsp. ruderalis]BBN20702.1 hypothetical protein Mp_zg00330 [Marchantia polymorpha subsp. ruderalis]BBN20727.1 hypothetical protein Mp_zg00620 [Marchantia polymorpha subsp. ruderalis]BBN20730.1 hypothetical protein Mp_zg00650 [Marchantia polymorpha subsp. ruderalis]BBN20750.1 hypothetical protein Mp_zg00960 [Marchantia polymorpha subsp. ruderalis]
MLWLVGSPPSRGTCPSERRRRPSGLNSSWRSQSGRPTPDAPSGSCRTEMAPLRRPARCCASASTASTSERTSLPARSVNSGAAVAVDSLRVHRGCRVPSSPRGVFRIPNLSMVGGSGVSWGRTGGALLPNPVREFDVMTRGGLRSGPIGLAGRSERGSRT